MSNIKRTRRPAQPPLVRPADDAQLQPPLAHGAARLHERRLRRQAGDRDPQHLERDQPLPFALQAARRRDQARRAAGGRLSARAAGDLDRRAVRQAEPADVPQPPRDGDRGAAALASGRRRGADGRLRQDDAGSDHGRDVDEPARDLHAGRADAEGQLRRQDARLGQRHVQALGRGARGHAADRRVGRTCCRASRGRRAIA